MSKRINNSFKIALKKNIYFFSMLFLFSNPDYIFSQEWHQYSDSIYKCIIKDDLKKAAHFIELAENNIDYKSVTKDTIYADYLYRKSVVKSFLGDYNNTSILEESLSIWNRRKSNNEKIMDIYYFLGANYGSRKDLNKTYENYENYYLINNKYKFVKPPKYYYSIFILSSMDYYVHKDLKKSKKYAKEYVDYKKEFALRDMDLNYIEELKILEDDKNLEISLISFLDKYNTFKMNNPELLYKVNLELFLFYNRNKNNINIIKYGEELMKLNLKDKAYLEVIITSLINSYIQIGDNINSEKYSRINNKYFPSKIKIDYSSALNELILANDINNFKIKFDEYEAILKSENNYNELLSIYCIAVGQLEINNTFNKGDVFFKLDFLNNNREYLTKEKQILLNLCLVEFYFFSGQINESLKISNNNLSVEDVNIKLKFFEFKVICEYYLGDLKESSLTNKKLFDILRKNFGNDDPRLLSYISTLLTLGTTQDITRLSAIALKIIYKNKLEQTNIASSIWFNLGTITMNSGNYKDAHIYFEKSNAIQESQKTPNLILYFSYLLNQGSICMAQSDFVTGKDYLDKAKAYYDKNPAILTFALGDYYYALANYYFNQDQYIEAKNNYQNSFSVFGNKLSQKKKFYYIICDYFIYNNIAHTIKELEDFQLVNKENPIVSKAIYLLKFNSGENIEARNLLVNQLKDLIKENNLYFHLLSDYEKETLFNKFSYQFELMNTHLLSNDNSFLKEYINLRFYSKSLLFSNSFKVDCIDEKNKELFLELKSNTFQINKELENKVSDTKTIEDLKNKNREIEKMLSVNAKPLAVNTLKDLYTKLKPGEAFVEIVRINKQSRNATKKGLDVVNIFTDSISYGAIIIKKNLPPKFILIDGDNQLESQYTLNFKSKIQNKQEDLESYHLLFEKIDNELIEIKKIYLVTDGVYNSINIESIYNPNNKKFLIDYLKIQQIQNVRAIIENTNEFKVSSSSKVSLFGNPDFKLAEIKSNDNEISLERDLDTNLLSEIKSGLKIGQLEGTQKEIESLNSILKDSNCSVQIFSSTSATEDNLKNIQSPDILHIATHGYFLNNGDNSKTKKNISQLINENYRNDSYLKSGLLFAGAENTLNGKQPENSNNGILTAEEAKSLNLKDTELVVLSACETGLGDNLVGEGVIGLQRAFMIAGAKSVIMSLWSVSDEKTQELMTMFYTNWIKNNMTKEEALHQAKLAMKKLYPEPYYWAGFVLLE